MRDALTPEEIAAYRRGYFHFEGLSLSRKTRTIGIKLIWQSRSCWRVSLCTPWVISFTFQTFKEYERYKLALGPYRNG